MVKSRDHHQHHQVAHLNFASNALFHSKGALTWSMLAATCTLGHLARSANRACSLSDLRPDRGQRRTTHSIVVREGSNVRTSWQQNGPAGRSPCGNCKAAVLRGRFVRNMFRLKNRTPQKNPPRNQLNDYTHLGSPASTPTTQNPPGPSMLCTTTKQARVGFWSASLCKKSIMSLLVLPHDLRVQRAGTAQWTNHLGAALSGHANHMPLPILLRDLHA